MPAKGGGVRLTPRAEADLEEIWLYSFKTWSLEQADRYHTALVEAFRDLASGRKSGRAAEVRAGMFKYPVGSHMLYYRIAETGLIVIRILHRRMDVGLHL
ncbi:type II toxin-antitoxin system RelE/ParE family toxin [Magnetospirillum moscoviense]|uniref:Toxin n=1 Tax=Magnetospirillum moscoviense TaxID=1437059 RepID=A0A178MR76_9PROT|nr:type II toxin-antitoxin system RelE/ParE family toxin [Magnetospirillum moscoviense]MBF0326519.1 type II toxin-antitoxin system RelE/ParE family toxin [Alphaproteobacteria bacterium]OAN51477.1 plasmid stabilization protein ParE [Magnetospirillum moscoviense]